MTTSNKHLPPHDVLASWAADSVARDVQDAFWQRVNEFESAPTATEFQRLIDAGIELPDPDALADEPLPAKLWQVIVALAELDVFLMCTDHLSDRALYERLWRDVLPVEDSVVPGAFTHIDLTDDGSGQGPDIYLMYYADEDTRRSWQDDFPEYPMPPHRDAPYDRDRLLPNPYPASEDRRAHRTRGRFK